MNKNLHDKMNEFIANQQVTYIKLHNLHWYVQGRGFFTLHAKLEELYDQTAAVMDDAAERLLALGGAPVASLKKALSIATVGELNDMPISSDDTVNALISDVENTISDVKAIVKLAEDGDDGATADQFNGYMAEYQKLLWMLKAYMS
jgi:starvation-inducible DNA-binding protein